MPERIKHSPIVERCNEVINELKEFYAFLDSSNSILIEDEASNIRNNLLLLADSVPAPSKQNSLNSILDAEVRRRCLGEAYVLSGYLSDEVLTLAEVITTYNIPISDIEALEPWLQENLESVGEANSRLRKNGDNLRRVSPPLGVREYEEWTMGLLQDAIDETLAILHNHFGHKPGAKEFFSQYHVAPDLKESRSYINSHRKNVGISVANTTYMSGGEVYVDEYQLCRLIGHEVFGHGFHLANTDQSPYLPVFLTIDTGRLMSSSIESVAQYFERSFFEELYSNPRALTGSWLEARFENIYKRYKDECLRKEYWDKLYQFGIYLLGQGTRDTAVQSIEKIRPYILGTRWLPNFLNRMRDEWDVLTGRLLVRNLSELRYCAMPVQRIARNATPDQLAILEKVAREGYWTPNGLEQWVDFHFANSEPI